MTVTPRTRQEVLCGTFASEDACLKALGIPCGYESAGEAACAKLEGEPAPTVCDCEEAEE